MAAAFITPDLDAVVSEIEVAAPPQRVFDALTQPDQLLQWWGGDESCPTTLLEFDPRKGGKWRMICGKPDGKHVVNGFRVFKHDGEILEFDPPRALAYTWITNFHQDPSRKTVVRWELTPTKLGTKVKVTHSGLADENIVRKDYAGGWPGVLGALKKFAEKTN
ncbi:MAG: SRPBCC domain-containing protein [Acidobacteriia bacterium]|nr:SRPBCC domain-containing protein [Terriglobia bacterium]